MKALSLLLATLVGTQAFAIPLQTWPQWVTTAPDIARQVPPMSLVARCANLDLLCVIEVDQTTGAIPVAATLAIDYAGATGDPVPPEAAYVAGIDPNGDLRGLATDVTGRLQIDGTADNDFAGATGDPVPPEAGYMAGIDGSGDLQGLAVNTTGHLQIDVLSSALPAGAATEAKQDDAITELENIGTILEDIDTSTASIDGKTPVLGQAAMAGSVPVVIASDQSPVEVDITTADVDIRDLNYTTDSVTAHQGGTWNIADITGTVSLPTGASTLAEQQTQTTQLTGLNTKVPAQGQAAMAASLPVVIASNQSAIPVQTAAAVVRDKVNYNYGSGSVTTAAYVEIVASTAGAIATLTVFEGSGQGMVLATGAASSEVDLLYIPPGGFDGPVNVSIAASTRLSIKAIGGTASTGRFIANFLGY